MLNDCAGGFCMFRSANKVESTHRTLFMWRHMGPAQLQVILQRLLTSLTCFPLACLISKWVRMSNTTGFGGTGDAQELASIDAVYGSGAAGRTAEAPLLIGSVKSNMGHCEGGSGLACKTPFHIFLCLHYNKPTIQSIL